MSELFEEYPLPWKIERTGSPLFKGNGSFIITASNGENPLIGGTYSGDGDEYIGLSYEQAKELVDVVNNRMAAKR
jgi:hypothetical protein